MELVSLAFWSSHSRQLSDICEWWAIQKYYFRLTLGALWLHPYVLWWDQPRLETKGSKMEPVHYTIYCYKISSLLRWCLLGGSANAAIAVHRLLAFISLGSKSRLLSTCSGAHCVADVWMSLGGSEYLSRVGWYHEDDNATLWPRADSTTRFETKLS